MKVKVTCARERGFLRAGRRWPAGTTEFDTAAWPKADRERLEDLLLAEHGKALQVQIVQGEPMGQAARKAQAEAKAEADARAKADTKAQAETNTAKAGA